MVEIYFKPIGCKIVNSGEEWINGIVTFRCTSEALGDRDHPTDIEVQVSAICDDGEWVEDDAPYALDAALSGPLGGLEQVSPHLAREIAHAAAESLAHHASVADELSDAEREYIRSALA